MNKLVCTTSTKEYDADKGAQEFENFNKFVENKIQKNGLGTYFIIRKTLKIR